MLRSSFFFVLISLVVLTSLSLAGIPKLINYQGMLTDNSGTPLTGSYNLTFKIYNDQSAGTKKWEETQTGVSVTNGLFNVILGSVTPIDTLSFSQQYWLDITVDGETMPTRLKFTSIGYAFRAQRADTANYAQAGGTDTDWNLVGKVLFTQGVWGIAQHGNILYGSYDSTHVDFGVACTTGRSASNIGYCTVGGGEGNTARDDHSTIGGGERNRAEGPLSTIGGGSGNRTSASGSTVGGGAGNQSLGNYSVISGGNSNIVQGDVSAILGGQSDTITSSADYSYLFGIRSKLTQDSTFMVAMPHIWFGKENNGYEFPTSRGTSGQVMQTDGSGKLSWANIGGVANSWTFLISDGADTTLRTGGRWGIARYGNTLYGNADSTHVNLGGSCITGTSGQNYKYCTVGGGLGNSASNIYTTIGGGKWNSASGEEATIGGGWGNTASDLITTVAGGEVNVASNEGASVGGGLQNHASGGYATIGGGFLNTASGIGGYATVGGGGENTATGLSVTVGGGWGNSANRDYATVGGGYADTASNTGTTIGGGYLNTASGVYAIIGGGESNKASGDHATIGGGYSNTASGYKGTICGGSRNLVDGDYSAILGGYADTITSTADYSFLFGIKSKLTDDSTFMVGMPYSRFDGNVQLNKNGGVLTLRTPTHDDPGRYGIYFANNNTAPFVGDDGDDQYFGFYTGFSNTRTYDAHVKVFGSASGVWGDYIELTHDGTDGKILTDVGDIALLPAVNVGIGTTTPGYKLDVVGQAHATSFPTSSDARLKKNVTPLTDVLEKLERIRGVSFDWNEKYEFMGRSSGHREIGVIAQEVEAVFPELVSTWGEERYRAVDYGRLTGVLIEAIKELKAENEGLKKRIEVLEAK